MSFTVEHHYFSPGGFRKARPAPSASSGVFQSQRRRILAPHNQTSSTMDPAENLGGVFSQRSEKEILQTLNDRFAGYIDKVRSLEMHNRNLEAEAEALRQNQAGRAAVGEHYERELGDLRGLLQQLTGEKASATLEYERLEEDIQQLRVKLEDEARNRGELEAAARAMKKYMEECRLARLELDRKLQALEEEADFLKKNHEEEVAELLTQIQSAQVSFDVRDTLKADVTGALREIRAQLDSHASKSASHTEEWFRVNMNRLTEAARLNQDAIRGSQEEIVDYRRQLQSRTIELETLRGTKESLERQRLESEDRHHDDLNSLQETINQLDNELKNTKWEMASQLKDYQELLNVKMALDIEIAAYRKLLEGEENRFVSGGSLFSYADTRLSTHLKMKGEEISDTVIVEEQTDETQVTEVTEEEEEEEEEEAGEEEKEGEDTKEEEEEESEEGKDKEEEKEEGDEKGEASEEEEKSKSPEKALSPPSKSPQPKSPQPKSPAVESPQKSPESKSPPAKSPAPKSPVGDETKSPEPKSPASKSPPSKSPASKSPESKSPRPKTPEPKSPEKEKVQPTASKDTPTEEKKEEKPQPVKEETKEQPAKGEKKPEPKEKEPEKVETSDAKKETKADEAPKKDDGSKPAADKPADDKQVSKPESTDSAPPAKEKPSVPTPEVKPPPKPEPEKTEGKKEEKKPVEKKLEEKKPEEKKPEEKKPEEKKPEEKKPEEKPALKTDKPEVKSDEKKPEVKKEVEVKDAKEGEKTEKVEKPPVTESKDKK